MRHSSDKFTVNTTDKTMVTEASDLGRFAFGHVFGDSCDEGLTIVSKNTGSEATFYISRVDEDVDNDVRFWELIPTPDTTRKIPALKGWKVLVFND